MRINIENQHTPKVSVIVPVYNVEKYIYDCLMSLCRQSLHDIEIICVNDCTPDDSMKIVYDFAKADKRIRVLEQPRNMGQDIARSCAMKIARGEYIGFVDSDDYVDAFFYENLYVAARSNDADIMSCYAIVFDENSGKMICKCGAGEYGSPQNYTKEDYFIYSLCNGSIWNRIFKKSLLNECEVDFCRDIRYIGDADFLSSAIAVATNISVLNYYGYVYVRRFDSTMRNPNIIYYDMWFVLAYQQAACMKILALKNRTHCESLLLGKLVWHCDEGARYFPEQRSVYDVKIKEFKRYLAE